MRAFAEQHCLPPAAALIFDRLIEALDFAYLQWQSDERERIRQNAGKGGDRPEE